jgi:hypothetical protein
VFRDINGMGVEDWFVNKKTGALVYIQGEKELNKETANKAFGETISKLIFENEKNDFSNWERLGDDTMFDTSENRASENGVDYKSESIAEDFAEKRGFFQGVKEKIKIEDWVSYDSDGSAGFPRETLSSREIVLDKGITYAKENSTESLPGGTTKNHFGGRVDTYYENRVSITKSKSNNYSIYIRLGKEAIELGKEILKKH